MMQYRWRLWVAHSHHIWHLYRRWLRGWRNYTPDHPSDHKGDQSCNYEPSFLRI